MTTPAVAMVTIRVSSAQLLQLVVQVRACVFSCSVSVFDQPEARSLIGSACAVRSRDTTPVQPEMPGCRRRSGSSWEDGATRSNGLSCESVAMVNNHLRLVERHHWSAGFKDTVTVTAVLISVFCYFR